MKYYTAFFVSTLFANILVFSHSRICNFWIADVEGQNALPYSFERAVFYLSAQAPARSTCLTKHDRVY